MPPPSSLLARLKATTATTEYSSGNDPASSSSSSRPSSLSRATASNAHASAGVTSSRPRTASSGRSSSLAKAAASATGTVGSSPSSFGRRAEHYNHNNDDGKCKSDSDGVEEGAAATKSSSLSNNTAIIKNDKSTVHAPSDNDTASATIADVQTKLDTIVKTKLTTLQQLVLFRQQQPPPQDVDFYSPPPPPYHMCSQSEAHDRAQYSELSPFEYSHNHLMSSRRRWQQEQQQHQYQKQEVITLLQRRYYGHDNRPTFDPHRVVKKYRRSAAGGGTSLLDNNNNGDDGYYRSMDMLKTTVDYLLKYIFVHQRPPPPSTTTTTQTDNGNSTNDAEDPNEISIWGEDDDENDHIDNTRRQQQEQHQQQEQFQDDGPFFSLAETVSFIDDRLRAVQKDLVTLLGKNLAQHDSTKKYQQQQQEQQQQIFETKRTARKMQAAMVRYNILASYLLSDLPLEKYEITFGVRALRTAMTSYRDLSRDLHQDYHPDGEEEEEEEISQENSSIEQRRWRLRRQRQQKEISASYKLEMQTRDEIMAYAAILHTSAMLYSEERALHASSSPDDDGGGGVRGGEAAMSTLMEDGGSGWSALLLMMPSSSLPRARRFGFRGDSIKEMKDAEEYPRWKWAVELASAAQDGNYQRYFSLLESGPVGLDAVTNTSEDDIEQQSDHARFLILARCCASHSLNLVRLGQLRRYNHSFGKGEAVSAVDVARLLRLCTGVPTTNDKVNRIVKDDANYLAADFCRDAGLPVIEEVGGVKEMSNLCVLMKSAPIIVKGGDILSRMCNPGRINDIFVFGSKLDHVGREYFNPSAEMLQRQSDGISEDIVDTWEDRDGRELLDEDDAKKNDGASTVRSANPWGARYDEDGVLIPSWHVLKSLIE